MFILFDFICFGICNRVAVLLWFFVNTENHQFSIKLYTYIKMSTTVSLSCGNPLSQICLMFRLKCPTELASFNSLGQIIP